MAGNILLNFKLDSLQKVGFGPGMPDQDFFEGLQNLQTDGIMINESHYDELCKNTISNGHALLKSDGIFNLNTAVVGSMAEVIGQYLFRLLFNDANLYNKFWKARAEKKKIEIRLEFNMENADSATLAKLPWELMYCPGLKPGIEAHDDESSGDGFFLSKETLLYREYVKTEEKVNEEPRELCVAVAFLIKDIENLDEVCTEFKKIAQKISERNSNIQFVIINEDETGEFFLLTKKDLEKIFLSELNSKPAKKVNKIIHIVCDVSPFDNRGGSDKSLFFKKKDTETEPIGFTEIFRELVNKVLINDTAIKMLVLQAWKDESYSAYAGFEEFAVRMLKRNRTAVVSMPYLLKQERNDNGKSKFFNILYSSLSGSKSMTEMVLKLRDEIMPGYSYGFPLFYFNGHDETLVGSAVNAARPSRDTAINPESQEAKDRKEYLEKYQFVSVEELKRNQLVLTQFMEASIRGENKATDEVDKLRQQMATKDFGVQISVIAALIAQKLNEDT